jgi:hypothetical protein
MKLPPQACHIHKERDTIRAMSITLCGVFPHKAKHFYWSTTMRIALFPRPITRSLIASAIAIGLMAAPQLLHAEASIVPTGVTRYDPSLAYNTYVLFSAPDDHTYLIDMDGNVVNTWNFTGFPPKLLDPAIAGGKVGHILLQYESVASKGTSATPGQPAIFGNKSIAELDWSGSVVWKWGEKAPSGAARQHHDLQRLSNGDTLVLANLTHPIPGFKLPALLDDVIYQVNPAGEVVWTWKASDHLEEFGFTPEELKLVKESPSQDYLHVNNMNTVGPNQWFDKGDQRFNPDNIIIDSRNANFIVIIDKKTGKIVWNLGPNYAPIDPRKDIVPRPVDQISGQHDAHLIPEGLPGAGHLLVFDNQGEAGYPAAALQVTGGSRVLEIDPITKQIVWEYTGQSSGRATWSFYSSFISSARRLPNGNTLIDEGMNGRIFQVTPSGEIVWEYVNPHFADSPVGGTSSKVLANWVYRAQPVPYDWVPKGTRRAEKAVVPPDVSTFRVPATEAH